MCVWGQHLSLAGTCILKRVQANRDPEACRCQTGATEGYERFGMGDILLKHTHPRHGFRIVARWGAMQAIRNEA